MRVRRSKHSLLLLFVCLSLENVLCCLIKSAVCLTLCMFWSCFRMLAAIFLCFSFVVVAFLFVLCSFLVLFFVVAGVVFLLF